MAYHGVIIPEMIAAMNIDSLNRSVISGSDVDNGNVFSLLTKSATAGESEVFTATWTAASAVGLWMAYEIEIPVTDGRFKGIDPDVRNFYNAAGKVFSAFKPQVGDIILVTNEVLASGSGAYLNSTAGSYKLTAGASQLANALSFKYLATKYISLATGAIDSQRVTAYEYECIAN